MVRLAAAANVLLGSTGLRSKATQAGATLSVSTTSGRSMVASDPGGVRIAAEQLIGHVLDPLSGLRTHHSGGGDD
jgi:hypothetical protein